MNPFFRHVSEADLIDIVEGTRDETSCPHLLRCVACAAKLDAARTLLARVKEGTGDDVPEPSPLFWDHLSSRIGQAVAAEGRPRRSAVAARFLRPSWVSWGTLAGACAAAVLLVFVRGERPAKPPSAPVVSGDSVTVEVASADEASWGFIADLAGDIDWDTAVESGVARPRGGVERVLLELDAEERLELERLVREELQRSGV